MLTTFCVALIAAGGSGSAVRLAEVGELELRQAIEISELFAVELRARTGAAVVLDDPTWECDARDRCLTEIRARTRMEEVVFLRVFGGPTRIQVEAERIGLRPEATRRAAVWIPLEGDARRAPLKSLAESLFEPSAPPRDPRADVVLTPAAPPRDESASLLLPGVLIGTAVAAGVVAAILGAGSRSAAADQETMLLSGDRRAELADRQQSLGIASGVAWGVAVAAALAGTVSLIAQ